MPLLLSLRGKKGFSQFKGRQGPCQVGFSDFQALLLLGVLSMPGLQAEDELDKARVDRDSKALAVCFRDLSIQSEIVSV